VGQRGMKRRSTGKGEEKEKVMQGGMKRNSTDEGEEEKLMRRR